MGSHLKISGKKRAMIVERVRAMFSGFCLFCLTHLAAGEQVLKYNDELFTPDMDPRFLDSVFNTSSLSGIFNNSLILYGGLIIGAIILFEIALYALDVYYNQTYIQGSGLAYSKKDTNIPDEQGFYAEYPPYYDPFQTTYRAFNQWDFNMAKILSWMALMEETWNFSDSTLQDVSCQQRLVCEIFQDKQKTLGIIGAKGKRDLQFLQYLEMLNPPDEIVEVLDNFREARETADGSDTCQQIYQDCDY